MKKVLLAILTFLIVGNFTYAAVGGQSQMEPLQDAFVRYKQIGWQTYEFFVITNLEDESRLSYEWSVDNVETFHASELHYFFSEGEHLVKVKVQDTYGNVRYDRVLLKVHFWSLQNNWLWWMLYVLLLLVLVYYWVAKIIYLYNRRKLNKKVRFFLEVLDEHGWIEEVIAHHVGKKKKVRKKKK